LREGYVGLALVIADLVLDLEAHEDLRVLLVADADLAVEHVVVQRVEDSEPEISGENTIA
jgi:hypothetical protein